jgi:hypothetical protein
MGTWGLGIFDSDDSTDFLVELVQSEDFNFIGDTLETVLKKGHYINIGEAYRGMAAVYIIRAIITGNFIGLPPSIIKWAKSKNPNEYAVLVEKSQQAIQKVKTNSELRDLWKTTPAFEGWLEILDDLQLHW